MIGPIVRATLSLIVRSTLSCVIGFLTLPAPSLVIRPIIRPMN